VNETASTLAIAEEIRLAVTPVFLLTAIVTLLLVLSQRLSRCVDRIRSIRSGDNALADTPSPRGYRTLQRRLWLIQWSIRLCILTAALVCVVVILIFASEFLLPNLSALIAGLFVASMVMLMASLVIFLIDIGAAVSDAGMDAWD
jgi:Ca2+/Na+ antiporter